MTRTADYGKLKYFTNEKPQIEEYVDEYVYYVIDIHPVLEDGEMSEEEILSLPAQIGMFSFLGNQEEDIYSDADGSPME